MTKHSLTDMINGLGDPTWFVPAGGGDLIVIRLMDDRLETARSAAKSLEAPYFITKGHAPVPPPISIPQEWLIYETAGDAGRNPPVKRIHSATIDAAHVWAVTMMSML